MEKQKKKYGKKTSIEEKSSKSPKKEIIAERLRYLVAEIARCHPQRIKSTTKLRDDLGIDSFMGFEILVAIEGVYGLAISEDEASQTATFGDLVEVLIGRLRWLNQAKCR